MNQEIQPLFEVDAMKVGIGNMPDPEVAALPKRRGPKPDLAKPVLLADLRVTKSHSRPRVSDDNPYSEARFKTLNTQPRVPPRFVATICLQ